MSGNGNGHIARIADSVEEIAGWPEQFGRGHGHHRPPPQPPSCFSELARLGQCYDDVQQMKKILGKVITDLLKNDPTITQSIIDSIQQSGTSVPLLGVTDGSSAQPGQVGEIIQGSATNVAFNPGGVSYVAPLTLPPGDWNVQALMEVGSNAPSDFAGAIFQSSEASPSIGWFILGGALTEAGSTSAWFPSNVCPWSTATPTLISFGVTYIGTSTGEFNMWCYARRVR